MERKKLNFCRSANSLSFVAGNMVSLVADLYKRNLPPKFLRSYYVSSSMALKELKSQVNNENSMIRKEYPLMTIDPTVDLSYESLMENTFFGERLYDEIQTVNRTHLNNLFQDYDSNLYIDYIINEYRMMMRVNIYNETVLQNLDTANYLKNVFRYEHPYYLYDKKLEANIPRSIIFEISKSCGLKMDSPEFIRYLNKNSKFPITYKLKKSSGNNEYFLMYVDNPMIRFARIENSDGSRKGMDKTDFSVSQEIELTFKSPGLYYYFFKDNPNIEIDFPSTNSGIDALYTLQRDKNYYNDEQGRKLETNVRFKIEEKCNEDHTDISCLIEKSICEVIEYNLKYGIDNNVMLNLVLYKDGVMLEKFKEYDIDYVKKELITKNIDMNATYRIMIYLDYAYINSILQSIKDNDDKHKS